MRPLNSTLEYSSKFYYRLNLGLLILFLLIFVSINTFGVMLLNYVPATLTTAIVGQDLSIADTQTQFVSQNNHSSFKFSRAECRIDAKIYEKYEYIDFYINIALGLIGYCLPCLLTLIINIFLSNEIRKNSKQKDTLKTTNFIIIFSFIYLFCYSPYSIVFLLLSLDLISISPILFVIVSNVRYLNHVLTFYINFALGKKFRKDIKKILCIK
jgi:hypothetical protein